MAALPRQLPEGDEVFLDHVGWFVPDLDRAANRLQTLGFRATPETVHMNRDAAGRTAPSGTVNRLAVLERGYLEFLGARGDTPLARQHAAQLARYAGLHLMAFASADVPSEAPRLAALGFRPLDPVDMRRDAPTPDGPREARFSVLRVPPDAMPEGRVQWCGHGTPELVWQDAGPPPNGARTLDGCLWIVADLEEALDRYSRFLRKPARRLGAGAGRIALDRGALRFATPEGASEFLPGVDPPVLPFGAAVWIGVDDPQATAHYLESAGVACQGTGDCVVVPPEASLGATLVFRRLDR